MPRDQRRTGIDAQRLAVRIERRHRVEIRRQQRIDLGSPSRGEDARDALAPLAAAKRLRAEKIVTAGSGMGVDHAKRRRLEAQMRQDARQHRVLVNVGETAGMKRVAIIHLFLQANRRVDDKSGK